MQYYWVTEWAGYKWHRYYTLGMALIYVSYNAKILPVFFVTWLEWLANIYFLGQWVVLILLSAILNVIQAIGFATFLSYRLSFGTKIFEGKRGKFRAHLWSVTFTLKTNCRYHKSTLIDFLGVKFSYATIGKCLSKWNFLRWWVHKVDGFCGGCYEGGLKRRKFYVSLAHIFDTIHLHVANKCYPPSLQAI